MKSLNTGMVGIDAELTVTDSASYRVPTNAWPMVMKSLVISHYSAILTATTAVSALYPLTVSVSQSLARVSC